MHFRTKLQFGGILASVFFTWFYGALVTLPIVDGQYETANNHCGGVFRGYTTTWVDESINFEINPAILNGNEIRMVCVWTIIPNPMFSDFVITINSISVNSDDKLSFNTFSENEGRKVTAFTTKITPGTFTLQGNILMVTFVSPSPKLRNRFELSWTKTDQSERVGTIRFVTTYNSYGKDSMAPLPYFAWGFMGNSLSTFAFPKGNMTEGFKLQMVFQKLELESLACSPSPPLYCDMLMLCDISETGVMSMMQTYNSTPDDMSTLPAFESNHGLFLIMWGGNYNNASGGGRMQMTYESPAIDSVKLIG